MIGNNLEKPWINTRAIFLIIFAFFFIFPALNWLTVYNVGNDTPRATTKYHITDYNVNMKLGQDNVLEVEENITVMHNQPMQGIIRAIPTFQTVSFLDSNQNEKRLNYKTNVDNVQANMPAVLSHEDGFVFIRLGIEGETVMGKRLYKIFYQVDMGHDRIKEFDQFYYNVIGHDWDTTISNISILLQLPKPVEQGKKLIFYAGEYGAITEQVVEVESDLKTFNLTYDGTLEAFNGITAKILLPQGYFEVSGIQNGLYYFLLAILAAIIIFGIIKAFNNKKQIITPVVMFTSPNGLPPSELGYILSGMVKNKDISALIVYWAQKGYLSIVEENKKYTLVKQSEISENAQDYEKLIFEKMFKDSTEIKIESVGQKIWPEVAAAMHKIKNKHFSNTFDEKKDVFKNALLLLSGLIITFICYRLTTLNVEPIKRVIVACLGFLSVIIANIMLYKQRTHFKNSISVDKNYLILFLPILAVMWAGMAFLSFGFFTIANIAAVVAVLASISIVVYAYKVEYRKPEGLSLLGEILGFKQFIMLTEKDRIEMLAEQNPEMFYDVLPYAYVLGISDEWIEKFEHVAMVQPSWLITQSNYTVFDYLIMRSVVNSLLSTVSTHTFHASTFNPTNIGGRSGGSGFGGGFGGGGGFSGGGFGGGGGRGW